MWPKMLSDITFTHEMYSKSIEISQYIFFGDEITN